jgi:Concanavalin A-like lectin/glucanases superfamily
MTLPGRLEAHWKLDENSGRIAKDSSGNGLNGRFSSEPNRIDGASERAVVFDGANDHVDFGSPPALRLVGSMTVSAWIKSTSYPVDDAAIVPSHRSAVAGYQLDTSVDRGPRTMSLKIADECGRRVARHGATPLLVDTWYHVAGVYDSTLPVQSPLTTRTSTFRLPPPEWACSWRSRAWGFGQAPVA